MTSPRALLLGGLALGCAGAFFIGRAARQSGGLSSLFAHDRPSSISAATEERSPGETHADEAGATARADWARLGHALGSATRSHAAPGEKPEWFVESAAERDDRHRTIDRKITETLGNIPAAKRQALIELNDEATQVQLDLQGALMAGKLSQQDFDQQMHQRVMVQLDQLHGVLSDDEYRKMTGLEPGVDPYEYMRTGAGGAQGQPEIDTTVPPNAPPKSADPDGP